MYASASKFNIKSDLMLKVRFTLTDGLAPEMRRRGSSGAGKRWRDT